MPTGYTAGILDGKIKSFPEFARLCMRAFGATIHMRDDGMDAEYHPRTPSDYHQKAIKEAKLILQTVSAIKDKHLIETTKLELEESKEYHSNSIKKAKENKKTLLGLLTEIEKWNPPTSEHTGIKDFMKDQIQQTIDWDCNPQYHIKELDKINHKLSNLSANKIREEKIEKATSDLNYHITEHAKDVERCNDANKWVEDFLNSLK